MGQGLEVVARGTSGQRGGGSMRSEIETYLGTVVDSTAKKISINVGLPQLDVAKELNRMHTEGVVEREKRAGGGNEYAYWLVRGKQAAPAAAENVPMAVGIVEQTVDQDAKVIKPTQIEAQSTMARLAAEMISSDVLDLLKILDLPSSLTIAIEVARERAQAAQEGRDKQKGLISEIESLKDVNARLKANNADLEKRIDALSGDVRPLGSVFVTMGREAKPKRHTTIEKAQRRASALIRSERESEVLVLEPIGRMVRGSEWRAR
ncbi:MULTISPECIES: 1-pyrroline-5-carboxylate dehydrogenase [unclassified Burkholderia]|nr:MULTISPECIES: 1-pyrroline-5-carboxylate dehydrogenase [unclassified Burkholderia]